MRPRPPADQTETLLPAVDPIWRGVVEALPDAVLLGDPRGMIAYANPAAEALLGWEPGELAGRPITDLIPPALQPQHERGFRRYQETAVGRVMGRGIRVPVLRRNGAEARLELTLAALPGPWFAASLRPLRGSGPAGSGGLERVLAALGSAIAALGEASEPEALPRAVTEIFTVHLGAQLARIWLHEPSSGTLRQPPRVRRRGDVPDRLTADVRLDDERSLLARAGRTGVPFLKNGLEGVPAFDPAWAAQRGLQSVALLPLSHGGELQGVLAYCSGVPISGELAGVLETAAAAAGAALAAGERAHLRRLAAEAGERAAAVEALLRDQERAEPAALPARCLELAARYTASDHALLVEAGDEGWEVTACAGLRSPITGYCYPPGLGAAREAARIRGPVNVPDYLGYPPALPPLRQRGVRSVLAVPVWVEGGVSAVLKTARKRAAGPYRAEEVAFAEAMAGALAAALRRTRGADR